ncbi:cobyrinic acid a,c-diamide synthase [bacterium]|nr:cobyrinic acid a,c-diamide synthase [bacterium]
MPIRDVLVRIEVQNPSVKSELEEIVASMERLRLVDSSASPKCDILIHEAGEDLKRELQLIHDLTVEGVVGEFLLTAPRTDSDLLIQAMRMGAKEFITQPIQAEEVRMCLEKALARRETGKGASLEEKTGVVIDVLGAKGGVGATTTAVNLAASLNARKEVDSVALIDMNLLFGDVPLFLDLKPAYSWGEIVKNIARLDSTFLMGVLTKHPSGIYVLPPPTQLERGGAANPETIEKILFLMKKEFDYIVIDSGQSLDSASLRILSLSDVVLLVSILSLPCLINVRRLLETFSDLGYPRWERVQVIVNRYHKKLTITRKEAEEGIDRKVSWLIPNDYQSTMAAINQGKLLAEVAGRAEVTKNIQELAASLLRDTKEPAAKKKKLTLTR